MLKLRLEEPIFEDARVRFNKMLDRLLIKMQNDEVKEGEMTLKLKVSLYDKLDDAEQPILQPVITHDISTKIQKTEKTSGGISGDYQLEFDKEEKIFVLEEVYRNQTSIYDK